MLAIDRILALDIGASSVKLGEFHAVKGQGLRLTNFHHADLGLDPEHEENRKASLVAAVRNMLREKHIRPGKIIFSVPGQSVFTRFVKLPPVDESKVVQIIQYEAQQNVPFPIQEVILIDNTPRIVCGNAAITAAGRPIQTFFVPAGKLTADPELLDSVICTLPTVLLPL